MSLEPDKKDNAFVDKKQTFIFAKNSRHAVTSSDSGSSESYNQLPSPAPPSGHNLFMSTPSKNKKNKVNFL